MYTIPGEKISPAYLEYSPLGSDLVLPAIGWRRGSADGRGRGTGVGGHGFHAVPRAGHSDVAGLWYAGTCFVVIFVVVGACKEKQKMNAEMHNERERGGGRKSFPPC